MSNQESNAKALMNKLEFNPVDLGGRTKYTSYLGISLGAVAMLIVVVYAVGKFMVIDSHQNVVSKTIIDQNDPYFLDLQDWHLQISIYQNISKQFVNPSNMLALGLNLTAWNLEGELTEKKNPSKLIPSYNSSEQNRMTIDQSKTPFQVSGSNYVHSSPQILQYLIQLQFCSAAANPQCSENNQRFYHFVLYMKPKWASLENPKQPGIRQMLFNEKIKIDRTKNVQKTQYTYDISGFNVSSDTSYLPNFIPRNKYVQNGSELAGPAIKIFLLQQSNNIVQLHFRRSAISKQYTRKFNSIDQIFAQILGVVALLGLILWILFAHYNSWSSEQYILKNIQGKKSYSINFFEYLKFYLTCKDRTKKQDKILQQVYQDVIQGYKQRKRRKIQIQVIKLRLSKLENKLSMDKNEQESKQQVLRRLQEEERDELFSSSILTEQIRETLLKPQV